MNDIDKYFAEQCGVELRAGKYGVMFYKGYPWSIKRADCREIVRERFKIITNYSEADKKYVSFPHSCTLDFSKDLPRFCTGVGKTISDAEIACLQSIYEARDE